LTCSSNSGTPYANEFTLNELRTIIDDAQKLGTRTIIFSGGEPFEHAHLIELCKNAKRRDLGVCIYTSGNISLKDYSVGPISKSALSYLKKIPVDRIIFGLQGHTEEIHDSITCVHGSFNNAVISIRRAVKESIPTEIHFVPVKLNYRTLPEMVMLAKKLGTEQISVLRFVAQGRGKANENTLRLEADELLDLKSILREIVTSRVLRVRVGAPYNAFGLFKENYCTAGRSRATIRADGFVFPCEAMKELPYNTDNDLNRRNLREIWENSTIFHEARNFMYLIGNSECRACSMFARCKGGCPAQRLISGISVQNYPDPYCLVTQVIVKDV